MVIEQTLTELETAMEKDVKNLLKFWEDNAPIQRMGASTG